MCLLETISRCVGIFIWPHPALVPEEKAVTADLAVPTFTKKRKGGPARDIRESFKK